MRRHSAASRRRGWAWSDRSIIDDGVLRDVLPTVSPRATKVFHAFASMEAEWRTNGACSRSRILDVSPPCKQTALRARQFRCALAVEAPDAGHEKSRRSAGLLGGFGGGGRNRTGVDGFAGRCMTTLPPRPGWTRPEQASIALSRPDEGKIRRNTKRKGRAASGNYRLSPGNWSGKRVSNSRPQPWQGCALPTELFPHGMRIIPSPRVRSRRARGEWRHDRTAAIASAT